AAAACGAHDRQDRACDREQAEYVGSVLSHHILCGCFLEEPKVSVAGVVHQHVDRTEALHRCGRSADRLAGVRHILLKHQQRTALGAEAGLEIGMLAAGGNDVVACAQCRLGDLDAEPASRARDEPGSCHDGLLRNCHRWTLAMVACISAITLPGSLGPVNPRTSPVHTVNRLPALCTLPIARNRSPKAGRSRLILNSAVTTSWSSGALVNVAYPQAVSR